MWDGIRRDVCGNDGIGDGIRRDVVGNDVMWDGIRRDVGGNDVMWDGIRRDVGGNGVMWDGNVQIGPRPVQRRRARDVATGDGNVRIGPRPVPPHAIHATPPRHPRNTPRHPRNAPTPSTQHPHLIHATPPRHPRNALTSSTQHPPRHSRVGGNLDAHSTNHSADATSDLAGARVFP